MGWVAARGPLSLSVKQTLILIVCGLCQQVIAKWPTRESFGMARGGPRFWALGVDSGPRGGAFEGILDPLNSVPARDHEMAFCSVYGAYF